MKIDKKIFELSKFLLYVSSTKILKVIFDKSKKHDSCDLTAKLKSLQKEVNLVKTIQSNFTPSLRQVLGDLDVSAGLIPSEEICGDTVNILEKDPNNYLFSIGDVCGHGIHTGILGGIVDALIYTKSDVDSLKKMMIELNSVIYEKTPKNMFVSLCLIKWDLKSKKIEYVNAGHEPILYYNKEKDKIRVLIEKGLALGIRKDISSYIHKRSIKLEKGDCLLLFSDGIIDACKSNGKRYGMGHLKKIFKKNLKYKKSSTIKKKILKDLNTFLNKEDLEDDATILLIKKK